MSALDLSLLLGNFGAFIGAIAVVVTLIYLAKEVRQNTASIRANAYQAWVSSNLAINSAYAQQGQPWRKGIADATQLDEDTEIAFGALNHSAFQMWQSIDYLYRMGAVEEGLWRAEISRAAGHLHLNPGVKQWWDAGGRTQLAPAFVELLETTRTDIGIWGWSAIKGYHTLSDQAVPTDQQ